MQELLRKIPRVDEVLDDCRQAGLTGDYGRACVGESVKEVLTELRGQIRRGEKEEIPERDALLFWIDKICQSKAQRSLRRVINGTGVILHTNLGRAVLSQKAAAAAWEAASHYNTLEYNLRTGSRGSRYSHVEELLKRICGCEAALVVNNNASAVLLILTALASGKEAVVSRGELVEIGGSFRVPDVMIQSGVRLVEVGTTNKTHFLDYERAISEDTAILMKVHTSNFRVTGFTENVSARELAGLAHCRGLRMVYDVGSGALFDPNELGFHEEPGVKDALNSGADLVCFSGDKLLGGPQAGIIVGKKECVDQLKCHPLLRALRIDKMTLAALEETLRCYLDPELAWKEIPLLRMMKEEKGQLQARAARIQFDLRKEEFLTFEILDEQSPVGGGTLPGESLPTCCLSVRCRGMHANELELRLRQGTIPVIGRIKNDSYLLDMRTIEEQDIPDLEQCLRNLGCAI